MATELAETQRTRIKQPESAVSADGGSEKVAESSLDNLRGEYFDCLASGSSSCAIPGRKSEGLDNSFIAADGFGITDDAVADKAIEAPQPATSDLVLPQSNWTLAFNLTTTEEHSVGEQPDEIRVAAGARNKTAELLELAASTEGKPITLVVQNAQQAEAPTGEGKQRLPMMLHTYLINDGQIHELPVRPSEGVAADTTNLLRIAAEQAPSERLALFAQGHGGGPHGVSGDTGEATLAEMKDAIVTGLAASGRAKLDLLDFDACSMGNASALEAVKDTASSIIASTEMEHSSGLNVDGQNVTAIVNEVLENPAMSPAQLGDTIVDLAAAGANGGEAAPETINQGSTKAGTPTLAHYDTAEIDDFARSLDSLGTALTESVQSDSNLAAVLSAIDATPLASTAGQNTIEGHPRDEFRDTKSFATNLIAAIEAGSITDPSGKLESAAEKLLLEQGEMVANFHGEQTGGYSEHGAVSTFLPGRTYLDYESRGDEMTSADAILDRINDKRVNDLADKDIFIYGTKRDINEMKEALGGVGNLGEIENALALAEHSTNQSEHDAALARLAESVRHFNASAQGMVLTEQAHERAREILVDEMDRELATTDGAWAGFLENLKASAY
jgi:hypothetical protein